MRDRSPTRPLLRRGLGVAASALLVAGSLFVPAAALASGASPDANDDNFPATEDTPKVLQASDLLANDTQRSPKSRALTSDRCARISAYALSGFPDLMAFTIVAKH